ncbi:uncharacterized protein LOC126328286 [Schistocerca gregaria]|uniref:uncharacterized protein LOC126328286 n=2 Tax=Schistocerca gregaria TaxID=7010 RepID=UPI00211DF73E|nr:uncharacterized protein LOC126328286 [Schistocerca gregaria]
MDDEINTDNTSDVLSHSHKIVDSILDTLEKWVKEEQELKVDNGEEIDNGFESDGNNDEVKAYIFDENGNLKAEVEVAEVESVLQNFREEEMMNEGGRNSNEVKESSSCVNVPQMVEGDDILMNSNIAQGRSCSEVEDSLADVQQTKVEKVVRCFDLKLVDRLEKAAKIIEHDEPQDVNVNVIATDQNYFSWKNIERDLLDEVCEQPVQCKITHPVIKVNISGVTVRCLLDSGSEASALSQTFFDTIPNKEKLTVMKVSGLKIIGATGKVSRPVQHEALIPIGINDVVIDHPCLIVLGLSVDMLIGTDFLSKYQGKINFDQNNLILTLPDSKVIRESFIGSHIGGSNETWELPIRVIKNKGYLQENLVFSENEESAKVEERHILKEIEEKEFKINSN